jgi:Zn-dependent protease
VVSPVAPPEPRGLRLAGIPIRVQPTFLLIVVFLGLAPGRSAAVVIAWVVVVTVSILVHEAGHAVAFRRFGHEAEITLTGFGGLTAGRPRTGQAPLSNGQHIIVSLAGPAAGLVLGLIALGIQRSDASISGGDWLDVLILVNVGWGLLNLLPVLPLDGGQVMAALLSMRWPRRGRHFAAGISAALCAVVAVAAISAGFTLGGIMAGILVGMNLGSFREGRSQPSGPRDQIALAGQQMRAGQWDAAVAVLRQVLVGGPGPTDRIVATQLLGWALLGAGRFDAVAELVNRERFNQVEVATLGAVNRLAQDDPSALDALAAALGDESVDPPSWAAAFLRSSPVTIDELAARSLALPAPKNTAAVSALVDWLARADLYAESITVAARAAQDQLLSGPAAARAAASARALGLHDDAAQWDALAVSLPPASPPG